ncbi:CHAT domain-containing protein [Kamptonema sp. UHCC 0994]|uniref:CHAT domain-containing protein n=1 Tax=Kamptonema sp. UHCC 0994 TaxID=3031329 RepID=UPI0023B93226|nr:CHAT domain-containing protein [Kamptonema sp. UHCC 0994]MDF0553685.1 CHAT domain-containing protein [Kamptonema sp. UHCC 0994]
MNRRLIPFVVLLSMATAIAADKASAQQIAPAADGTGTTVTPQGNRLDIDGGSRSRDGANLFHSFDRFGLNSGQIANFISHPEIRNILGRIVGGDASYINGLIQITGGNSNLFLINPAGIVFGPNASLNVPASFTATTANGVGFGNNNWLNAIGNNNWATLVGTPSEFRFDSFNPGSIINSGNLTVGTGESLTLLGGSVINTGTLAAPGGDITIAAIAGKNLVRISQQGRILNLEITPSLPGNNGNDPGISPISLPQLLTGGGGGQASGITVNAEGQVVLTGGTILPTEAGTAIASGNINVSGNTGGTVNILGQRVGVIGGNINAAGSYGGGTVLVGGDIQGKGPVPNALQTFVSNDSVIDTSAIAIGNGGKIIVFGQEAAYIGGTLRARGGVIGGNGGFIETSGLRSLAITSVPDIGAPAGIGGEWLIDPYNIDIVSNPIPGNINLGCSLLLGLCNSTGNSAQLPVGLITGALLLGDVTISTGAGGIEQGNINLNAPLVFNPLLGSTLTLNAHNDININQPISGGGSVPLNLVLNANNGDITTDAGRVIVNSSIATLGGNISALGRANIAGQAGIEITSGGSINSGGGNINLNGFSVGMADSGVRNQGSIVSAGGVISITGASDFSQGISIESPIDSGGGNIILNGTGVNQTGVQILNLGSVSSSGGDITIAGVSNSREGVLVNQTLGSGGGDITLTGTSLTANDIVIENAIHAGVGNLTLGGNHIVFSTGTPALTGNNIVLQPYISGNSLSVTNSLPTTVTFNSPQTTFGRGDTNGTVTINGNLSFSGQLLVQSPGGTIAAAGSNLTGLGGAIVFQGSQDISTGNITNSGGTITITSITGNINTSAGNINTNSGIGNGGAIALTTSTGNIITNGLYSYSSALGGNGGNITLKVTTAGDINTNASADLNATSISGNGGTIALSAPGNIATGNLNAGSVNNSGNSGNGGTISVEAGGKILAGNLNTNSSALNTAGNAGNVTLSAPSGSININNIDGSAIAASGTSGNGGAIAITATGNIISGNVTSASSSSNAGNITLGSTGGTIGSGNLNASANNQGGAIAVTATGNIISGNVTSASSSSNAGNIALGSTSGTIGSGNLNASANNQGGAIAINATGNIISGNVTSASSSSNAGNITLGSTSGTIGSGNLNASANNQGGAIAVTATGNIISGNVTSASSSNAGNITLGSTGGTIGSGNLNASANNQGGAIAITATGDITTGGVQSNSTVAGSGGNITVNTTGNANIGSLDSTSVNNAGGAIAITAPSGITAGNINSNGLPNTGNITLTSNEINFIDTSVQGKGTLLLSAFTPGSAIAIGGPSSTTALDLTAAELNQLNGFTSVTIGETGASGNLSIGASGVIDLTSNNFNLTVNGGATTFTNTLTVANDRTLTMNVGSVTSAPTGIDIAIGGTGLLSLSASGDVGTAANPLSTNISQLTTTVTGNAAFSNSGAIAINPSTISGKLNLSTTGAIVQTGPLNVTGATTLNAPGNDITLNNPGNNFSTVAVTSGNNVTLTDANAIDIGNSNIAGTFNATANGVITGSGNIVVTGATTLNANGSDITLESAGNDFSTVIVTSGDNVRLHDFNSIDLGTLTIPGTLNVTVGGNITQSGAIGVAGATAFNAIGDITLLDPTNAFGAITLTGQNASILEGAATDIAGVVLGGNLTLTSSGAIAQSGTIVVAGNTSLNAGSNDITSSAAIDSGGLTLTGGNINLNSAIAVGAEDFIITNSGELKIVPASTISVVGDFLQNGTGNVTIGGNITNASSISFAQAVTVSDPISLTANNGEILFQNTVDGYQNLTLNAGTGNVTFSDAVGGNIPLGNLTVNSSGTTRFANTVNATSLTTDAGGKTEINGNVTTTDNQNYGDAVTIASNPILTGNGVTFNSTLDGNGNLTVNSDIGNVTFSDAVGGNIPLGNLTVNSSGTTRFANTVNATSLTTDAGGKTEINGNVTTTDNQNYGDAVTITNNPILTGNGVTFNSTLDANSDSKIDVTVNSPTGNVTFSDAVGSNVSLGNLTVNSSGTTSFASTVKVRNLTTDVGGKTEINGNVTTTAAQNYGDAVTIANNPTLTGNGVTFNSTLDGNSDITVNSATGNITFNDAVGSNIPLGNLVISSGNLNISTAGKINLTGNFEQNSTNPVNLAGNITTTGGTILFNGPITLIGNASLSTRDRNISFNNTVNGNADLNLTAGNGDILFNGTVGDSAAIGNLTIFSANNLTATNAIAAASITHTSGTGTINVADIQTSGGGVNLATANNLTTGNITTAGGNIHLKSQNDAIATGNLNSASTVGGEIFVDAKISITTGAIDSSGSLGNGGNVTLDPIGDVQVESINAQGGPSGTGGNIFIESTGGFFRARNSFATSFSPTGIASISAGGGIGGGSIIIRHVGGDGGPPVETFEVGNGTINGTAAAITNGDFTILPSQSFRRSFSLGNIALQTDDKLPTPEATPTPTPTTEGVQTPPVAQPETPTSETPVEVIIPATPTPTPPVAQPETPTSETPIEISIPATPTPTPPVAQPEIPTSETPIEIIIPATPPVAQPETPTSETPIEITIPATPIPSTPPVAIASPQTQTSTKTPTLEAESTLPQAAKTVLAMPTAGYAYAPPPQTSDTVNKAEPASEAANQAEQTLPQTNFEATSQVETTIDPIPNSTLVNSPKIETTDRIAIATETAIAPATEQIVPNSAPTTAQVSPNQTQTATLTPTPTPNTIAPDNSQTPKLEPVQNQKISPVETPSVAPTEQISTVPAIAPSTELETSTKLSTVTNEQPSTAITTQVKTPITSSTEGIRLNTSVDNIFESDIEKTISNIEQYRNQEYDNYLGIKNEPGHQRMTLATMQETLKRIAVIPGKPCAIIYVIARNDQLELILVTGQAAPIRYSIPAAKKAIILPIVEQFRTEITNPRQRNSTSYLSRAQQLYQWIIAPLEKDLKSFGIETLLFSLDAGLRSMPIAALHDGKQFLIEKYSFSLIPSFTLTNSNYASIEGTKVLAMGASEFKDKQPLPSVPIELHAIVSDLWPGQSFLNEAFTLENLRSQRLNTQFGIVHLATHATFSPGEPQNSYIQLWNSKLQINQITTLNWDLPPVELLVLSACRTALGDRESELGFGGLAIKAGAKSALASLWYVSDEGTMGLMMEFYQELRHSKIKAEALREAQLAMISGKVQLRNGRLITTGEDFPLPPNLASLSDRTMAHPFFWSGFTMVGSPW